MRPEGLLSLLDVPLTFPNAQLALEWLESPCRTQPAKLQNENGEVCKRGYSCKVRAWAV